MSVYAVILLHENGLPIYKKFARGRERPVEPLIAAILGLSQETGLGDIAHARFEKASIIVLRGAREKKLILSLFVRVANHLNYLRGIYLMNKLEKAIDEVGDIITDDLITSAERVIETYFDKLKKIPDVIGDVFMRAAEKFGPMFYGSIMIILFRRFNEDPLITLMRNPKLFIKELDKILGPESTNQFLMYMFHEFCGLHKEICERMGVKDIRRLVKRIIKKIRKERKEEVIRAFRNIIENIIDEFLEKS